MSKNKEKNKRASTSQSSQDSKKKRGSNYTNLELETAIRMVVTNHTFRIGEEMANKGFPEREASDNKKMISNSFSLWRRELSTGLDDLECGDDVVLMINNKAVGIASLNWFGHSKEEGERIQDILFPSEIDSVWFKSIYRNGRK